jgi:exopolyphosphatase/guanosine-5'-triphosphate,3'-diphosphate pyrophosphatase
MLYASIDIGSNAVRLLFANAYDKDGYINVEKATIIRIPVRLGMDVFRKNMISEKREKALIKTLQAFRLLIDVYKPVAYKACATAAMREAGNGKDIIKKIRSKVGIKVKIIDGIEEANIIRSISRFDLFGDKDLWMFIDVGGGSTEISLVSDNQLMDIKSFKIGTIRLLEKKVKQSEWEKMVEWLNQFSSEFDKIGVIGSGGNINKIAKIYGAPQEKMISVDALEDAYNHLKSFSVEERIENLGLRSDRADVIVPAARIFLKTLNTIEADKITVPKIGLADGLIYKMYEKHLKNTE